MKIEAVKNVVKQEQDQNVEADEFGLLFRELTEEETLLVSGGNNQSPSHAAT